MQVRFNFRPDTTKERLATVALVEAHYKLTLAVRNLVSAQREVGAALDTS